jgi:hypothetical protein
MAMDELVTDADTDERLLWGLDCVAGQLVVLSRTLAVIAWQFDSAPLARLSLELRQRVGSAMQARQDLSEHRPSRAGRPSVRVGWGRRAYRVTRTRRRPTERAR